MTDPIAAPEISVVVSTIGRPEQLRRLVRSLCVEHARVALELVVVDQSATGSARAVLEAEAPPYPWTVATSARGVSRGRNAGLALARGGIVTFPDDDCWYPGSTLRGVVDLLATSPDVGCTTMLRDGAGRPVMLRWSDAPGPVTRRNYYRTSIGPTVVARTAAVRGIGGYDERIGPGAGTPYGSCEDADVLVRLLEMGTVRYHPELTVHHDALGPGESATLAEKMYGYGYGQGWFWRRHHYPTRDRAWFLGRKCAKVALGVCRGRRDAVAPDAAFVRGALGGLCERRPANGGPGPAE